MSEPDVTDTPLQSDPDEDQTPDVPEDDPNEFEEELAELDDPDATDGVII